MRQSSIEQGLITETIIFCRRLREHGLAVTPSEAIDALTTLDLIDPDDRQETFLSLRSVLTSRLDDYPVYEKLFDDFWNRSRGNLPRKPDARAVDYNRKEKATSGLDRHKNLAFFLENWGSQETRETEPIRLAGASNLDSSTEKDFSLYAADEIEEVSRLARRIVKRLARNPSRRWKPARHGRKVDLRRTFRQSLGTGGEITELSFKQRKLLK